MDSATVAVAGAGVITVIAAIAYTVWRERGDPASPPVRAPSTTPSMTGGDDEHVRYWLAQVAEKAKSDGKLELPAPQEIALRMNLSECNEHAPCGERVQNVIARIAEGIAEKAEIKNVLDAEDYWTLRVMLGYPVPTAQEIVTRGVGSHACLSQSPPCEKELAELVALLKNVERARNREVLYSFNERESELRRRFVDEWKSGVASKKVPEGDDVKKSAYMALCRERRMRGIDCDANYAALQNAIRKELGLPVVGIVPGSTGRMAGVPDAGTNLNDPKLNDVTFYPVSTAEDASVVTSPTPFLDKMKEEQRAGDRSYFESLGAPKDAFVSPAVFDRLLTLALA